jgi:hypothetical protein
MARALMGPYPQGGEGASGQRSGGGGRGYSGMSPAEFNQSAQNRANAGFLERNAPSAILGLLPGGMLLGQAIKSLDDSAFKGEQQVRSADFIGKGQMSPDDFMAGGSSLTGAEGVAGANAGGGEYGGLGGMRDGGFAEGGFVTPDRLMGPDPAGPDEGFAALMSGEVVLTPEQQREIGLEKIARALMAKDPASVARPGEMDPMSVVRPGEY